MTQQEIRERILKNISDEYKKGQGEFFFDIASAVAIELEKAYERQEDILNKGFVDTAKGLHLDRLCSEQGISRKAAVKAIGTVQITGAPGAYLPAGSMVASDNVGFITVKGVTLDSTGQGDAMVECSAFGKAGNVPLGAIKSFPVTIAGFYTVTNSEPFTNGYDGEPDDELRQRYYIKVRTPATSGNKYHYMNWALEVPGVGGVKVFPLFYGNGTVKVVIMDANKRAADETLQKTVAEHIEAVRPIGAGVTIESVTEKLLDISIKVIYDTENNTQDEIKENITAKIEEYLKSIAFVEKYLSFARVGAIILSASGVIDYENLTLNGTTENIDIADTEILVLGGVYVGE